MAIRIEDPRRFVLFIGAIVLVFVALVFQFVWGGATVQQSGTVTIEKGTPAVDVWDTLVAQGYTDRTLPWRYYGWRENAGANIQAGRYVLERGEHVRAVINRFISGETSPDELTVTYPEGFTLEQIAERTAARGIGTKQAFMDAAQPAAFADDFLFLADIPQGRDLEGYLFPDTYRVFKDDTPEDVIRRMLATFDRKVVQADAATSRERTLDEVIIMASIIEREVTSDQDMALVSGVLWKRFDEGQGLAADATVRYVLNKWDGPLTAQDLAVDSPYNTRRYRGLPPGPISNPGLRAIRAAANPEASDYYYYLSAPNGETIFAETNAEHNRNKEEHLR